MDLNPWQRAMRRVLFLVDRTEELLLSPSRRLVEVLDSIVRVLQVVGSDLDSLISTAVDVFISTSEIVCRQRACVMPIVFASRDIRSDVGHLNPRKRIAGRQPEIPCL